MNNPQPIFDPATHYRIEVQGQVDVEWLQSFDSTTVIVMGEKGEQEGISVIEVRTHQAGIVAAMFTIANIMIKCA